MISAVASSIEAIQSWRDRYREEMPRQIVHDSLHYRRGWTQEYALRVGLATAGYGSIAKAGPWIERPTI